MNNYDDPCVGCKFENTCELSNPAFCYGCVDEDNCKLQTYCEAGHPIQCNNGFELKRDYVDDEGLDEQTIKMIDELIEKQG